MSLNEVKLDDQMVCASDSPRWQRRVRRAMEWHGRDLKQFDAHVRRVTRPLTPRGGEEDYHYDGD